MAILMAVTVASAGSKSTTDARAERRKARALARYQAATRRDPVGWMSAVLGFVPWEAVAAGRPCQADIPRALARHDLVACRSSNAVGKTRIAAACALWWVGHVSPGRVITTSASWRNVEKGLWPQIHALRNRARCREFVETGSWTRLGWELAPEHDIISISSNDPENYGGFHAAGGVLAIIDEASSEKFDDETMAAIRGVCATAGSKILMIGNPLRPAGPFYEAFRSEAWHCLHISAFDTPNVASGENTIPGLATREWVEQCRAEWGEDSPIYSARVRGDFPEDDEFTLIRVVDVTDAQERWDAELFAEQRAAFDCGDRRWCDQVRLGVDVADQGAANTVVQPVVGPLAWPLDNQTGGGIYGATDPMQVAGLVARAIARFGIKEPKQVKVDAIGVGSGTVARLVEQGLPVTGVNVAGKPHDPAWYLNQRAEAAWALRGWLREGGGAIPPGDRQMEAELTGPRLRHPDSQGRVRLEPKEETSKRLGRSPDRFDALMLAVYSPPVDVERVVVWDTVDEFLPDGIVPGLD